MACAEAVGGCALLAGFCVAAGVGVVTGGDDSLVAGGGAAGAIGVGLGVGVGVGTGAVCRSGMMRGAIGTPARSSTGP